ncbi:MAG: tRNA (adenine-N1)-methyltransferase [Propionibacteriaceae bacterium]|jgi:tRNA (adenine57-N1/adenine58-N1)-methyltransferase|nr:tRNA (adenine-N1)-methyltransferase [Propionibacteriaceae bacterium]
MTDPFDVPPGATADPDPTEPVTALDPFETVPAGRPDPSPTRADQAVPSDPALADDDSGFDDSAAAADWSGVKSGPLAAGQWVSLIAPKGRRHSIKLTAGAVFHSTWGGVEHDRLIGQPDGQVVTSAAGVSFLALRPLLEEYTVSMPRGAAVIYPKDASYILMFTDVFPGARVLEAGAGSGALSLSLLRAIGPQGRLYSYERRADFAAVASRNVTNFFGAAHPAWRLRVGDLVETIGPETVDRAILDMLAPWECVAAVHQRLAPGGLLCCYVATCTQMGRVMDTIRAHGGWTEPRAVEINVREWHAEGLAIRPGHAGRGHTGFIVSTRRLGDGVEAPLKRRRPAPGAYGPDYDGPRPRGVETPL